MDYTVGKASGKFRNVKCHVLFFRAKENILFESVIVTEEFCKELAAIAYVKYHHSM